jgi:hypothetical protein
LKQQSILKRSSVGAENKSTGGVTIGAALIHTQADSGSSMSSINKKGAGKSIESGNRGARKVVVANRKAEENEADY